MVVDGTVMMLKIAKELNSPVIVTEQYVKALGPTVSEIKEVLDTFPPHLVMGPFEKKQFSMIIPPVRQALARLTHPDEQVNVAVMLGVEAHVCVQQTVQALLYEELIDVIVPRDCVSSRNQEDKDAAIETIKQLTTVSKKSKACIMSAESIAFNCLRTAEHEKFKAVSALVKPDRKRD